ncbi:hypothetical protein [Halorussus salinisoli]|uniref:hypothetical protein n=1 Tax=Halorussus salinisoli TaxID=2558242 RepID=UPI0010C22B1E|nr:hypothetical protein [Halorussus salinisoli]
MGGEHTRRNLLGRAALVTAALTGIPSTVARSADIERLSPAREVSVVPGTQILFEVAVRDSGGDDYRKRLYVNGERSHAEPDAFYGQLDRADREVMTHTFDRRGTHRVRLEFHRDGATFGTVRWTVRVADDGDRPPTAERLEPRAKVVELATDESRRRTFRLRATDPDGELDRVVWWSNQCDEVVGVSPLSGSRDEATVSYDPYGGCPLRPAVVDADGAVSWDDGWILRRADAAGHYVRIESEGGGVARYEFSASESVRQVDEGDEVDATRASGRVGPERGEDLFYFEGDLTELTVDGPASVWVDGEEVDPANYPGNDAPRRNTIEIVSQGGGVARYEFSVNGSVRQRDSGDDVSGNVVSGHVGPDRGTDTFGYTGEITSFSLSGPASVYRNGERVDPDTLG